MRWKIWYADGTTKEGVRRTTWANAPSSGVVGVATRLGKDEHGRVLGAIAVGGDWYWWDEGGIDCGATGDGWKKWIPFDGPYGTKKDAKRGSWVEDDLMESVRISIQGYFFG